LSTWFVAPNGSSAGAGTQASPWDLATALAGAFVGPNARIVGGDTVNLLPGVYKAPTSDGFNVTVQGTSDSVPIMWVGPRVAPYATIDGNGTEFTLAVNAAFNWFLNLEIMDSSANKTAAPATPGSPPMSWGASVYAIGTRIINCIIHDTAQGISAYDASGNSAFYGNLSYYNGYGATDRNHGHGIYMQNLQGNKQIENNLVFDNADEGLQIYGSGNSHVNGFRVNKNAGFNNSSWPVQHYQYNLMLAGGGARQDNQVDTFLSFFSPSPNGPGGDYGFQQLGDWTLGLDLSVTNSTFAYGYTGPAWLWNGSGTFKNNKVVMRPPDPSTSTPISCMRVAPGPGQQLSSYAFDNNAYFGNPNFWLGSVSLDANGNDTFQGTNGTFANWQGAGLDKNSTFSSALPTGQDIYVFPNAYQTKRAHVVAYNWSAAPTISVDLSGVLAVGDAYVIQDAQNFFGPAVVSATYDGKPVSLPTNLTARPTRSGGGSSPHTAPFFLTFVVIGAAGQPVIPPTPFPNGLTPPPPPPPPGPPPPKFVIGQVVAVEANIGTTPLNIRSTPDPSIKTNIIGTEAANRVGTVVGGPVTAGNLVVYQVAFADITGWAVEDYLVPSNGTPPPPPPPPSGPTYAFSVVSGSLPPGLTLGAATGLLSGTPTAAGTFSFTVQAACTSTPSISSGTLAVTMTINTAPPPPPPPPGGVVVSGTPPAGTVGTAYSFQFGVTGGK